MPAKKTRVEKVQRESAPVLSDQLDAFRLLFPETISEAGKIDFDKLRITLGQEVDSRAERYAFSWAGKRESARALQVPTTATLAPVPKESANFETSQNLFIEGENLEVLKLLYKPYFGRVKMIYVDPPYNTGKDFVYPDDYADPWDQYLRITGQKDGNGNLLTSNPETSGRFHSKWLSMMYPRLFIARQLLRDDGVIFVTIDDTEAPNLRLVMNEIFGEENFVGCVVWQHSVQGKGYAGKLSLHHNYIFCYQRTDLFTLESLERTEEHNKNYSNPDKDPNGDWRSGDVRNALYRPNLIYDITTPSGKTIKPPDNGWRWSKHTLDKKIKSGEIVFSKDETRIIRKIYLKNVKGRVPESIWFGKEVGTTREATEELKELFGGKSPFDTPKPTKLIRRMLEIATEKGSDDIVLDFFAGSSPTAQAVLELNQQDGGDRRFIMVQLPEQTPEQSAARKLGFATIADIGKERIRRVLKKLGQEGSAKLKLQVPDSEEDRGFRVFKLRASNYKKWAPKPDTDPTAYAEQMTMFLDPLIPKWDSMNVLWEVALKEGYSLSSHIEMHHVPKGITHYRIADTDKDQSFILSLDDSLNMKAIKSLNLGKDDLFICRDKALTDEVAANLALQCRLKAI